MKIKKVKAPARDASRHNKLPERLTDMDSDEILQAYGNRVAGGEKRENKKREKMRMSGKSVLKIREIIIKKSRSK